MLCCPWLNVLDDSTLKFWWEESVRNISIKIFFNYSDTKREEPRPVSSTHSMTVGTCLLFTVWLAVQDAKTKVKIEKVYSEENTENVENNSRDICGKNTQFSFRLSNLIFFRRRTEKPYIAWISSFLASNSLNNNNQKTWYDNVV